MKLLEYKETKRILKENHIPLIKGEIVSDKKEAESCASRLGFPVAVKVFSPEIIHRTEKNLVVTDIENKAQLGRSFPELYRRAPSGSAFLVQKQIEGIELACGMKRDPSFGPAIMFGWGGTMVEALKDIQWGIAPLGKKEAEKMISSTKVHQMLKGRRGGEKVDISGIAEILVNLSRLSLKQTQLQEIDFNPIIANQKQIRVADFKLLISE